MPNEKSAVSEFLTDVDQEKSPFLSENQDPFAASEDEKQDESKVEDKEEKAIPFHKDPKVLRFIEKQVEKRVAQAPKSEVQQFRDETQDELTDVLTRVIGNDTDEKKLAIRDFKRAIEGRDSKVRESVIAELEAQEERQRQEDRQVQEQLDNGFEEIEDTYSVDLTSNAPSARKLRSEYVDFITRIAPKNEEGEVIAFPDLISSFEEFQERQKRSAAPNRAKELASRGMSSSRDASQAPQVKDNSWRSVDRLFSRFTK